MLKSQLIGGGRQRVGRFRRVMAILGVLALTASSNAQADRTITSVTLNGASSVTVAPSASIAATVAVTTTGSGANARWRCTGWRIDTTDPGSITGADHGNHNGADDYTESFNITAPASAGTYNTYFIAYRDDDCDQGASEIYEMANAVIVVVPPPTVTAITRASLDPTYANTLVSWTVTFSASVTGVDQTDFILTQAGGATGANITAVTGSGNTRTVTANTGTGNLGTVRLDLVDNDSIVASGTVPLGGAGAGNGNFNGQAYTLLPPVCTPGLLFCDDFERSNPGAVGNGWTVSPGPTNSNCDGNDGNNTGCAGIDSDVPPFNVITSPRANSTRAMFTRWSTVTVTSKVIDLSGQAAAQISFWLRRGSDCFSEWPGDIGTGCNGTISPYTPAYGEEFRVQYLNNAGTWVSLAQYPMTDTPGEILRPVIDLPEDALHSNFQLRFFQPGGSGDTSGAGAPNVRGYDYWHVDDVIVRGLPGTPYVGAFCDTFEGDLSRWTMTGTGNARIGSTHFQNGAHNLDLRWSTVSATTKPADMSTATGNLTYWVKRGVGTSNQAPNTTGSNYPETGKSLRVEYLNSGNSWVTLDTFAGGGTAGQVHTRSYNLQTDIPGARHSKFKLRFTLLTGTGFDLDYWHVDDVCVGTVLASADLSIAMSASGSFTPGQVVKYTMTVTNNGPEDEPGPITITDQLPDGTTFISGSAGWDCTAVGQTVTCTRTGALANGNTASLTFDVLINDTATGIITNTATVGGQSLDTAAANNTASRSDSLVVPSFEFTNAPCVSGTPFGPPPAPCDKITWSPQTAGQALSTVYITAVNASNTPTHLSGSAPTTINMQFGLTCHDPKTDAGVKATFSAASADLALCKANGAMPTSWGNGSLVFPTSKPSVGPYSFSYADVGVVELYMRNAAATAQVGTSGQFVVKPAGFVLSEIKPTSDPAGRCAVATTPAPALACANAAADAARFVKAGEAFSATVKAVAVGGTVTPNYGNETSPESVKLSASNTIAGMVTAPPVAGSFGAFASVGGVRQATGTAFTWDEVGIVQLVPSVADGNYLGAGDVTGAASTSVGRFYPNHFETTRTHGCGTFTYSGQSFPLRIAAYRVGGSGATGITQNYNGATGFARKLTISPQGAAGVFTGGDVAGQPSQFGPNNFTAGTTPDLALPAVLRPTFTFSTVPSPQATLSVRATDTDGVTSDGAVEASTTVRSGRLWLANAYGNEFLPLPVPMQTQFWTSTGWARNADDNCTALTTPTSVSGLGNTLAAKTAVTMAFAAGDARFRLSAPGAGNIGLVDIDASVVRGASSWLALSAPSARACFGRCGPRSPVIYSRERF